VSNEDCPAPNLERELIRNLAEHEVFMSFDSDHHAVAFDAWWNTVGEKAFVKWYGKNKKDFQS
jgi:hypothetical protein